MAEEQARTAAPRRRTLSREAVLRAAVELADEAGGRGTPTMRALAERLGVEAMSLYHHVRNKEALLDGMVDLVFGEIELPPPDGEWRDALRLRSVSAREVLIRHRWAIGLMDSRRNPGPATLRHHDAVLGRLRTGGFSVAGAAHAFSVLDSYVYGFALQELSLPFDASGDAGELAELAASITADLPPDAFPHLTELITEHALKPDYAYADEFTVGLDLVLDGLAERRSAWP
ncbi:TetR/AcrR family transcriptional regulator [Streptomyces sp. NPDC005805]|uniref:TetR/AcrR family transcriptional regulator n=1 Tax=Streptomyces sp. NPDC005805 TaxID=3157068 RepID=UPI0033FF1314